MLVSRFESAVPRQSGFTIIELLISILLSLIVIGAVLGGYLAVYTSSINTLASSKLNQDLASVMSLMVNEIRRAGFSGNSGAGSTPSENVFNDINDTALMVFSVAGSATAVAATGNGSCLTYAYDADLGSSDVADDIDTDEVSGFRLSGGAVQIRTIGTASTPNTCVTGGDTWQNLTDPNVITIDALNFNLANSVCLNTREPDGVDNDSANGIDDDAEADCYDAGQTPGTGDTTVETRDISITLTGSLTNDSFVTLTLNDNVRVRNDLVRVR